MNFRKIFFLIVCVNLNYQAICQKPNTVFTIIRYTFSNIMDTNHRDRVYSEEMVLYLSKDMSLFKSYDKSIADSIKKSSMNESLKTGVIDIRNRKKTTNTEIYKNMYSNKMIIKQKLINYYIIEDSIPQIKWNIINETKVISDIKCQKAIGKLKGRIYEAWFSTQFPYNNGPWKLGGLPGLIIEAYDTKKEVVFRFDGLQQLEKSSILIEFPKDGTKTTASQFEKLKEAFRKDPIGFINTSPASNGITTRVEGSPTIPPRNPINNPIELPDNL